MYTALRHVCKQHDIPRPRFLYNFPSNARKKACLCKIKVQKNETICVDHTEKYNVLYLIRILLRNLIAGL